jgi:hypothetical protein
MARVVDKLTAIRASGSELQKRAVDRILPPLEELAVDTTEAPDLRDPQRASSPREQSLVVQKRHFVAWEYEDCR